MSICGINLICVLYKAPMVLAIGLTMLSTDKIIKSVVYSTADLQRYSNYLQRHEWNPEGLYIQIHITGDSYSSCITQRAIAGQLLIYMYLC